jgi:hypothetical protein
MEVERVVLSDSRTGVLMVLEEGREENEREARSFCIAQAFYLSIECIRGKVAAKCMLSQLILSSSGQEEFDLDSFIQIIRKFPIFDLVVSISCSDN